MIILGIDPGTTGACAVYDSGIDFVTDVFDIPNMEREYGKGLQVNGIALYDMLVKNVYPNMVVVIEEVGSMPKQGVVSSFNFGHTVGTIYGVVSCLGLDRYRIHPTAWKRKLGLIGTHKYGCMEMVKEAYPESRKYLTLKKHHNRADAIAIAIAFRGVTK